jgi:hypothetical protein
MVENSVDHRFRHAHLAKRGREAAAQVVQPPARDAACCHQFILHVRHVVITPWLRDAGNTSLASGPPAVSRRACERQPMRVQPVRLAVLGQLRRLRPGGPRQVEVLPVQAGGLATAARNGDQEPAEIAHTGSSAWRADRAADSHRVRPAPSADWRDRATGAGSPGSARHRGANRRTATVRRSGRARHRNACPAGRGVSGRSAPAGAARPPRELVAR